VVCQINLIRNVRISDQLHLIFGLQNLIGNRYKGCIPAALVTVGSNVSSLGRLLARLNDQLTSTGEGGVVVLESGDTPNLKTTLKNIIRAAVTNTEGNDGYQKLLTDREVRLPPSNPSVTNSMA
jgi:hypothetical protein